MSGLADASVTLRNLKVLKIVDSPIRSKCVGALCFALVGFAHTLAELEMGIWNDANTSNTAAPFSKEPRCQILNAISRMRHLRQLRVHDWNALAGDDCDGGAVLHELQELEHIEVGSYPCSVCNVMDMACQHFDADLPFKVIPTAAS